MKKSILFGLLVTTLFVSCSKDSDKDSEPDRDGTINGFWKGSTNTYGVGVLIRANGTARSYLYTDGLTMPDTSASNVYKADGTYTLTGNQIAIDCPISNVNTGVKFNATVNEGFTSMSGTSIIVADFTITQSFSMTK